MKENTSPHILNTSANLLGLCFIIITYLKNIGYSGGTITDKVVGIAAVFFAFSSFYSFLSMKSQTDKKMERRELVADISFFAGLSILLVVIIGNVFRIF